MTTEGMAKDDADGPAPFPWKRAMAIGFGRLGLSSADFWNLTPRELAAAIESLYGAVGEPIDRGALDRLIGRYPDRKP